MRRITASDLNEELDKIVTVSTPFYTAFSRIANEHIKAGYKMVSANCGIIHKDGEDVQVWQAIFELD